MSATSSNNGNAGGNSPQPPRSPSDHKLSGRTCAEASSSYEGDSEEESKEVLTELHRHQQKVLSKDITYSSSSGMEFDSTLSHPPHSQHVRQVHVIKPVSNSRHHRGCSWSDSDKVALLVDGKRFIISPSLLIKHPNTMLGR